MMEAMACGLPVVAANIPTTREFAGEAAVMFDPYDVDDMAHAMGRVAHDAGLRAALRSSGLRRATDFAPARVAAELIATYERAREV